MYTGEVFQTSFAWPDTSDRDVEAGQKNSLSNQGTYSNKASTVYILLALAFNDLNV